MFNADIFIIPNSLAKASDFFPYAQEKKKKFLKLVSEINNIDINVDEEFFVEVWATSKEELGSENLERHGFTIGDDPTFYRFPDRLPVSIFEGHKEGDYIIIKIPVNIHWLDSDEYKVMEFSLKLNQLDYRYRRFGTFEKCLEELKKNY